MRGAIGAAWQQIGRLCGRRSLRGAEVSDLSTLLRRVVPTFCWQDKGSETD